MLFRADIATELCRKVPDSGQLFDFYRLRLQYFGHRMTVISKERKAGRRPVRRNHRLQELRINEGLSPNDLGRRAGVSGQTVRMCEAGYVPGPRIQFQIAEVFGLRPLDIWPIERQP